jgi:hypothetical protein
MARVKRLFEPFEKIIKCMAASANANSEGMRGKNTLLEEPSKSGSAKVEGPDRYDRKKLSAELNRDQLSVDYTESRTTDLDDINKGGSVLESVIVQRQHFFLSTMQRDYLSRKMTRIRSQAHAASRLYGHGHDNGVLSEGLLYELRRSLARAGDTKE